MKLISPKPAATVRYLKNSNKALSRNWSELRAVPSGITYHTIELWPTEWRETAYNCMVGFWTHHGDAKEWQGRWLVPLFEKGGSIIQDLKPSMLLDVLRKIWLTPVMSSITSILLKLKVLRSTQNAYLPQRGTDSAGKYAGNRHAGHRRR